jgi:hypothetical protein
MSKSNDQSHFNRLISEAANQSINGMLSEQNKQFLSNNGVLFFDNSNNNVCHGMTQKQWETALGCSFPFKCTVQFGEAYGKQLKWDETTKEVTLNWKDNVNPADESGITIDNGDQWGYAEWSPKKQILARYYGMGISNQEHILRILK